ncbi:MAG: hypothetical protein IJJ43_05670 [Oscillospiraceae bacterium]|nr:hypothetical protein [Oscillospiraceae bacterium]
MSDYTRNIHRSGRRWFVFVYFFIYLFPVVTSAYFDAWPTWKQFFAAAIGVVPIYWAVGIVEAFSYMPMLGPGGSYLGFITGNMSNMKVPVALNAIDSAGVQQNTEEGDVISTIAIAVSSLVTLAIIIVFIVLMVPLTPVFASEALQPAFGNVVPALFGGLMVAFLSRTPKVAVPVILITAALFIAVPALKSVYPIVLPIVAAAAIWYSRMLYKKGKI